MLLIDIDEGYFGVTDQNAKKARKVLEKSKVDWPNAILSGGWTTALQLFNAGGYGKIIIDKDGIVRGINVHGPDLEKVIAQCLRENPTPPAIKAPKK